MPDLYIESIVRKKTIPGGNLLRNVCGIFALINLSLALFNGLIFLVPALPFGLVFLWAYKNVDVEFEYLHMGNSLEIDKITGNSRRKSCVNIDLNRVIILAPVGSDKLKAYSGIKVTDYSSKLSGDTQYEMVCSVNGVKKRFRLQFNEKMKESLSRQLRDRWVD